MKCIENKIANSTSPLKPIILSAILRLYQKGKQQITPREVKVECYDLDKTKDWNGRLPTICNGMHNVVDCGWKIMSEDRDYNESMINYKANHEYLINNPIYQLIQIRELIGAIS